MDFWDEATTMEQKFIEHAKKTHTPIHGSIELLPLCNMNCNMCYVRLSKEEMEKRGRLRTAAEWLEIGRQMAQSGVLFLLLTGGEPLLLPDFKYLYCELRKMGFILTINTNGTLIDEDWATFFGKYKPRRVNITLYGANRYAYEQLCHYPDGFNRTIQGIQLLKNHGVDVKISSSITPYNQQDIEEIIKIGRELDAPVRIDTYMMPAVRERHLPFDHQSRLDPYEAAKARITALRLEMEEPLFTQYALSAIQRSEQEITTPPIAKPMSCLAGSCSFSVNWQGELHPCVILTAPSASVFEMDFENAWKHVQEKLRQVRTNAKCSACHLRHLCRTCAASGFLENGSYDAIPEYMCQYAEESLRLLKEYISIQGRIYNESR